MSATQNALAAKGTLLQIGDGGGPEAFTTIAEVVNLGGPSLSQEAIDVTNHSSGGDKEFVGGLRDGGEVSAELNFVPTETTHRDQAGGLLNDWKTGTCRNFKIVWPDTTEWSFAALVTAFEASANVDSKLTASVTLKVVGQPTLA